MSEQTRPRVDTNHPYLKGTTLSNEEILKALTATKVTPETVPVVVDLLAQLVTKRPSVGYAVVLGPSKLATYLQQCPKRGYSTLHTMLQMIRDNKVLQVAFHAYENDQTSRRIMNLLHEQEGNNRVAYLHVMIKSINHALGMPYDIRDQQGMIDLFNDPRTSGLINTWIAEDRLKKVGGETNTHPGFYDWILEDARAEPDLRAIRRARFRIDLGGGFTTAEISRLFGARFISHDIISPEDFSDDLIFSTHVPRGYANAARRAPYRHFDVFEDSFERGHGSYVVASFGFLTSTVTSTSPSSKNEKSTVSTLVTGLRRIVELVGDEDDVYCYWVGRGTRRIYQNTVIQLRWKKQRLVSHKLLAHQFSEFDYFKAMIPRRLVSGAAASSGSDASPSSAPLPFSAPAAAAAAAAPPLSPIALGLLLKMNPSASATSRRPGKSCATSQSATPVRSTTSPPTGPTR